jgi:3-phenylpropionate/trans-cinnamate dioxygenase beta subunit
MLDRPLAPPPLEVIVAVTQALHREARLLDNEDFDGWLAMLGEDIGYRLELKSRRFRADRSKPLPLGPGVIFYEDLGRLKLRIDRLKSGYVWAEDPPNFVRRVVSNVEVMATPAENEVQVHSVLVMHRNRIDGTTRLLTVGRTDLWRSESSAWLLAARDIVLDHAVLPDSNLNAFF